MRQPSTKMWHIKAYNLLSKADYYIIGFVIQGMVYIVTMEKIPPRFIKLYGDHLRIKKFSDKDIGYLMRKGATYLCNEADLLAIHRNRGMALERYIKGLYNIDNSKHDSTPFYTKGDITIDHKEVQIKFDHGHMAKHNTLVKQLYK